MTSRPSPPRRRPPGTIRRLLGAAATAAALSVTAVAAGAVHDVAGGARYAYAAPTRSAIAATANAEVGTTGDGNQCQKYGPLCADWCAMFVTWVWERAGVVGAPRGTYVATEVGRWGADRGLFKPRPAGGRGQPLPGDIVVYGAPGSGTGGHVSIVYSVNPNGSITTIDGNYNNRVARRTIDPVTARAGARDVLISGYVTPPGVEATPPDDHGLADVTGDGFTDLVAFKPDGTMWLYSNNFVRDGGWPYSDVRQIGQGWNGFDRVIAADATGDGYADLVAFKPDGTMWLYSNNIERDDGRPYSDVRQIGHGWNAYDRIVAADATGDGFTDLVALKPDGTMWLFSNNFVRDGGQPYGDVRQIGTGWNGFDRVVASDATGDGFTDLVALKPDGTMWLYSNNFVRDGGRPYGDVRQIGTGWNNFNRIVASDATGDGYVDLVAFKADGTMWLYSNNFARDGGRPYGDVRQIGQGWNAFNRIVA
ncbi:FG-GAP-like repeat-containing protein [Phytohabitans sp. ZYX-F-186]|uniref:FG-GAP-like repeat-containing protein n=1 Tax=Phytohabitans maris TaxID=3071409 RepID=A0ABU0ZFG0_9ACTN|nr:FG-GAP-like repeat-containing protein [Phytohabitans sp. ZYX-F-186]MDQ7905787.1 FG-GAP-like repeat-containing protein [Phytohabitans sp. ZYX-F-186]